MGDEFIETPVVDNTLAGSPEKNSKRKWIFLTVGIVFVIGVIVTLFLLVGGSDSSKEEVLREELVDLIYSAQISENECGDWEGEGFDSLEKCEEVVHCIAEETVKLIPKKNLEGLLNAAENGDENYDYDYDDLPEEGVKAIFDGTLCDIPDVEKAKEEMPTLYDQYENYTLEECGGQSLCVTSVALREKNASICDVILQKNKASDLEYVWGGCVNKLAVELTYPSLCEKVGTVNEDGENYVQSDCYLRLAQKTKDPAFCDLMTAPVGNTDAVYCRQGIESDS